MSFKHDGKSAGDLIRSADWNALGSEVERLDGDKLDRAGNDAVGGPLSVRGDLTVGAANAGAAVRVLRKQEDASGADHGALVLGTDAPTSASLRLGYGAGFSWLQGSGQQALALNPRGGNVGVGTPVPASRLSVAGSASVGGGYAATAAPANGLIVQGNLGIGVAAPQAPLEVGGDVVMGGSAGQRFIFHTRRNGAGEFLQLTVDGADGNWDWGKGIILRRDTGNVGIGTTSPQARLHVAGDLRLDGSGTVTASAFRFGNRSFISSDQGGSIELGGDNNTAGTGTPYIDFHFRGLQQDFNARIINDADGQLTVATSILRVAGGDLRLDANREIFMADNGQIRSADNNHRILFRRSEDKMELREYGSIIFSPGATAGQETKRAWIAADGVLYARTALPSTRDIKENIHSLGAGEALDLLNGLRPVSYNLIEDEAKLQQLGFIAEEVPASIASPDRRAISTCHIVAVLTRVVKEQQRRLDELTHRLEQVPTHA